MHLPLTALLEAHGAPKRAPQKLHLAVGWAARPLGGLLGGAHGLSVVSSHSQEVGDFSRVACTHRPEKSLKSTLERSTYADC